MPIHSCPYNSLSLCNVMESVVLFSLTINFNLGLAAVPGEKLIQWTPLLTPLGTSLDMSVQPSQTGDHVISTCT